MQRRTQLQAPARPPGARPAEPAGVGASEGPAKHGTRAPCTAPTLLPTRHSRPPHGTPSSRTLPRRSPLRRTRRSPRGHPPPQSSAHLSPPHPALHYRRAFLPPSHGTPRTSTHTPLPPAGAAPTLAPALRATGCTREPPAEFAGCALGSAAAPGWGRGLWLAEPLYRAGPARSPGPSPAAGAPGRSRARWAPSWRQVAQRRRRRGAGGGGGARGAGAAEPRETLG